MTHLLRALITLVAVIGIADPAIATRNARGRTNGVSRGHRLRCTTQAERPALIRDADLPPLLAPLDRCDGNASAEESTRPVSPAELLVVARITTNSELPAVLAPPALVPFGRAPPF